MTDERTRILEMLAQGKITAEEAGKLLDAIGSAPKEAPIAEIPSKNGKPKYLRVAVSGGKDNVNIRVPLQILRAGVKLASLIPNEARGKVDSALGEKGIDIKLADLDPKTLEELIEAMGELTVEVESGDGENVRIFCE